MLLNKPTAVKSEAVLVAEQHLALQAQEMPIIQQIQVMYHIVLNSKVLCSGAGAADGCRQLWAWLGSQPELRMPQ